LTQLLEEFKKTSHEAIPKMYFSSSFIHKALGEVVFNLYWGGEAGNRSFVQLLPLPQIHVSSNDFKNSFIFAGETEAFGKETASSGAVFRRS
jgi:hypothetical protein